MWSFVMIYLFELLKIQKKSNQTFFFRKQKNNAHQMQGIPIVSLFREYLEYLMSRRIFHIRLVILLHFKN